ncbi:hypothetical protein PVK06_043585 [Gossypium arboreum]|uniref:Uncharacterized protein n=1 Tax=Gossypium arboreum TaxID=29729 RepID=A0ABR0MQW0_GOSAR|nr:hypothetical protein PVK06_043585 [Gossypium arboreum]
MIIEPIYSELTLEFCTTFHLQHVMNIHDEADRHRRGSICLGLYVTSLARHFALFGTPEMSSTLTLVRQMARQGISSMIHMRMIERRHGFDPPQYKLVLSDDQDELEDITDDVPPSHEDPHPPPPPSH